MPSLIMDEVPVALSDGDIQGVLDFLYEAGEVDGPELFIEPVLMAFRRLIPSDRGAACNVFSGLDPNSQSERRTVLDFADVNADWCVDLPVYWNDEFDAACRMYVEKEEAIPPQPRFMFRPARVSDVLTYREQRARALWWHVERHVGAEGVSLWLPAPDEGVLRRINVGAEKRGGIRDRDVRVLELLTPHLVQLYRQAAVRRAAMTRDDGLTPREYEIMSHVGSGKTNKEIAQILWVSPNTVRKHLENVFEKLGVSNRTAAASRVFRAAAGGEANGSGALHD
jgi:DNA-binding CsgD family transcriptional regulator